MKTGRMAAAALAGLVLVSAPACNKRRIVERVDPETVSDLDYRFDEDDARATAHVMIDDALSRPWVDAWMRENAGKQPVMIVGTIRNDTSDYIDTKLFTKQFERELLNSGRVSIVAARDERGEVRDERLQGREWSRPETVKKVAYELGADYMLIGRVGENVELSRNKKRRIQYYQVNMEMVDLESNQKAWIGEHQVEKRVQDKP